MQIILQSGKFNSSSTEACLISAYTSASEDAKTKKKSHKLSTSHWPKEYIEAMQKVKSATHFHGNVGETFSFILENGTTVIAFGMGEKSKLTLEKLRRELGRLFPMVSKKFQNLTMLLDSFIIKNDIEKTTKAIAESIGMSHYTFDKYKANKSKTTMQTWTLWTENAKSKSKNLETIIKNTLNVTESINFARDLVNEAPNVLNSEVFAEEVVKDAKKLKRVKIKVFNKAALKKDNFNMFLSVNNGSAFEARLVHLTYTPAKITSKTRHVALVGKGLTFDTGGYSLKPGAGMMNMKYDMAGAATVYAAFRACVLLNSECIVSCFLGMTDNAVNEHATMPDTIVRARNGKTVEILNTDAEGRLVLGDVLDYACEQNPSEIIDAATLTGAVLVALGNEICGVMTNNNKLVNSLLKSAEASDEYLWQLPLIQENSDDIKSHIADLKNIGSAGRAGTITAGAFLKEFIKNDIPWAHLDIAGVGDSQAHLPYCPKKGPSGIMVRTLVYHVMNGK
jgi:leucyl aminopeptidase